jgi:uncharacterized DUF497 family protein
VDEIRFQWDPRKAATNLRKHGVSFTEAETVFADERGLLLDDPEHSTAEDRFILLGASSGGRLLVVVYAYRPAGPVIRILARERQIAWSDANTRSKTTHEEELRFLEGSTQPLCKAPQEAGHYSA